MSVRPNLPGRATHYRRRGRRATTCGRVSTTVFVADTWDRVNCKICLRAKPVGAFDVRVLREEVRDEITAGIVRNYFAPSPFFQGRLRRR